MIARKRGQFGGLAVSSSSVVPVRRRLVSGAGMVSATDLMRRIPRDTDIPGPVAESRMPAFSAVAWICDPAGSETSEAPVRLLANGLSGVQQALWRQPLQRQRRHGALSLCRQRDRELRHGAASKAIVQHLGFSPCAGRIVYVGTSAAPAGQRCVTHGLHWASPAGPDRCSCCLNSGYARAVPELQGNYAIEQAALAWVMDLERAAG